MHLIEGNTGCARNTGLPVVRFFSGRPFFQNESVFRPLFHVCPFFKSGLLPIAFELDILESDNTFENLYHHSQSW